MNPLESNAARQDIVLVGFMGCGKSTIARLLHQRLGYPLVEMDQMIEEQAGKSIPRLFEEEGEAAFRDRETGLLRELAAAASSQRIISTGGGIVGSVENRERLRSMGFVVWLKVTAEAVLERTARTRHRPLLQTADPEAKIRELMALREPMYHQTAHLALETAGLNATEIVAGILECARYHFTHPA